MEGISAHVRISQPHAGQPLPAESFVEGVVWFLYRHNVEDGLEVLVDILARRGKGWAILHRVVDVEKQTKQQASGTQEPAHNLYVFITAIWRNGAEASVFHNHVVGTPVNLRQSEEIRLDYLQFQTRLCHTPAQAIDSGGREINGRDTESTAGQIHRLVTKTTAGNKHCRPARKHVYATYKRFQASYQGRRRQALIPGRRAIAVVFFPEANIGGVGRICRRQVLV